MVKGSAGVLGGEWGFIHGGRVSGVKGVFAYGGPRAKLMTGMDQGLLKEAGGEELWEEEALDASESTGTRRRVSWPETRKKTTSGSIECSGGEFGDGRVLWCEEMGSGLSFYSPRRSI